MSDKDHELFLQEMHGVVPLPATNTAPRQPRRTATQPGQLRRRLAAGGDDTPANRLTIPDRVEEVGPLDIVGHRKDGVQEGVYRKLRLGKYDVGAHLDLHRVKVRDACDLVAEFLRTAWEQNRRTVLITHGKGVHSPVPGVMKSYVMHWLQESDLVLAWHSAQPRHGGTGATYVLVRKSSDARQQAREQFSR